MKSIGQIISAILRAMAGTWKVILKGGKIIMEWTRDVAIPATWSLATTGFDAAVDTTKSVLVSVPNLLGGLVGRCVAVAPAPSEGDASAPLKVQRQGRQNLLDAAAEDDRKRGLAICVKAAARWLCYRTLARSADGFWPSFRLST